MREASPDSITPPNADFLAAIIPFMKMFYGLTDEDRRFPLLDTHEHHSSLLFSLSSVAIPWQWPSSLHPQLCFHLADQIQEEVMMRHLAE